MAERVKHARKPRASEARNLLSQKTLVQSGLRDRPDLGLADTEYLSY